MLCSSLNGTEIYTITYFLESVKRQEFKEGKQDFILNIIRFNSFINTKKKEAVTQDSALILTINESLKNKSDGDAISALWCKAMHKLCIKLSYPDMLYIITTISSESKC